MQDAVIDQLNAFIRKKKMRRTPEREAVVRLIFSEDEHFTNEELYERARRENLSTSRATIYRTIEILLEAGLLREIDLGRNQKTYDPNFIDKPSHNHLVCIDCGKVVEFEDQHVDLLNDCVTRRHGFRPVRSSIKIEACCDQLRLNGSCPNHLDARLNGKRLPASSH